MGSRGEKKRLKRKAGTGNLPKRMQEEKNYFNWDSKKT